MFVPTSCENVVIVPDTNNIRSAIKKVMLDMPSPSSFQDVAHLNLGQMAQSMWIRVAQITVELGYIEYVL